MDKSLHALCAALKKILWQLKPQNTELSFLLLAGKDNQGKTTLLRQSHFEHITVDAERSAEIYFNQQGVILDLGESWLNQSHNLLQLTLKKLNHCHRTLKISGIILCLDINDLLASVPIDLKEYCKSHTQLLKRFGESLNYRVKTTIFFTKVDALAGFCEFFQNEHESDLIKPLGFSIEWVLRQGKPINNYKPKFEQFIEVLGQQVMLKMHPARSSVKRTLIREFPLQLATLGRSIQTIINSISPRLLLVQSIYFTSGEQGGVSLDRLNKKIQHEYALVVQDKFPQSINHRAYFIEGALAAFQTQTKQHLPEISNSNKWSIRVLAGIASLTLLWIGSHYLKSSASLDKASKELLAYDAFISEHKGNPIALYHLTKAGSALEKLASNSFFFPNAQQLKTQLNTNTKRHLQGNFLPSLLADIEQTIVDSRQSQATRYQALKIYLMLGDPTQFSLHDVLSWFQNQWQIKTPPHLLQKKIALLKQTLKQPFQPITINHTIVSDVRNYLNALPAGYLYYTLAKENFSKAHHSIKMEGFDLEKIDLPVYFTKSGFQETINQLPRIAAQLQADNWVLARQDLTDLPMLLQQAYCYEYFSWWNNFAQKSRPQHYQNYQQARQLTQALHQSNAINQLIALIQKQTSPELDEKYALFNREVGSKFTELSLMSNSTANNLKINLNELERYLTTLSMVNDQGKTAFNLAKASFDGSSLSNPLNALYSQAHQLPEPIASWAKQIADDAWFILINDARNHINQQWLQTVIRPYQDTIAHRYPFDTSHKNEVSINDFNRFFGPHGLLNTFVDQYLRSFLDMSQPQWQLKERNNYVLPISSETINQLIRANVISNMFFTRESETSQINFSLQKLNLDPIVSRLQLSIGNTRLSDTQSSDNTITQFRWPQINAKLTLNSIEGQIFELEESGPWAFFKLLQKVNVLVDEEDSSNLQILFEVNGNSGRYVLKTQNQINPFIPGILNEFTLTDSVA
jgi:intracellular multiplication protein IcmF